MTHQVLAATAAGGADPNEDFYLASESWAIVLDGVTRYPDDGCIHDVPWFAAALGGALARRLVNGSDELSVVLRKGIQDVSALHGETCDLQNPVSPAATVAIVRIDGDRCEWLVLGDCAVVWRHKDGRVQSQSDPRLADLPNPPAAVEVAGIRRYPISFVAEVRNSPGGFWVASTDAAAAAQAYTGAIQRNGLEVIALFSDGLTRLVERYGSSWSSLLDTVATQGVPAAIEQVREAENDDPRLRSRGKRHDDATGVLIRLALCE